MKIGPGVHLGRYRVGEHSGHGGMATVFKADQPGLEWAVSVSEMQGGRTVDIGVTVSRNAITVYVDGRRVRNATESPSTGAASPSLYIDGKSAPLHILSLRHYATS